ncbi:MAG: nucleoside/nucleotide kinase family protein, partial [Mycobacteriales bacterium]
EVADTPAAIERARSLAQRPGRTILGITGPPGSGKSTLAAAVCTALGGDAALVPMDGFHLADTVLDDLGRRDRKGAPETFDSHGYAALLGRVRRNDAPVVYAPAFERDLEQPIAGAIAIAATASLVVTEGNYLLCEGAGWPDARALLDEVWYCDLADEVRLRRLTERHVAFGKTLEQARRWIELVDTPNAERIAATRSLADWVVALE